MSIRLLLRLFRQRERKVKRLTKELNALMEQALKLLREEQEGSLIKEQMLNYKKKRGVYE